MAEELFDSILKKAFIATEHQILDMGPQGHRYGVDIVKPAVDMRSNSCDVNTCVLIVTQRGPQTHLMSPKGFTKGRLSHRRGSQKGALVTQGGPKGMSQTRKLTLLELVGVECKTTVITAFDGRVGRRGHFFDGRNMK